MKPQASERFPHLALNEYLCMTAASLMGIEAAGAFLLYPDHPLLVVERFDRAVSVEKNAEGLRLLKRVHQEDLCQALGRCSDEKYEGPSSACLSEMVKLLMAYAEHPPQALHDLHRLMLYNYLIGNCDAHLKNYSLIWSSPTSVRLAPAYDLVLTAVYDGRFGVKLDRSMGLRLGRHLNIDKVDASDQDMLAREFRQSPQAAWEERRRLQEGLAEALQKAAECAAGFGFGEPALDLVDRILFGAKIRAKAFGE